MRRIGPGPETRPLGAEVSTFLVLPRDLLSHLARQDRVSKCPTRADQKRGPTRGESLLVLEEGLEPPRPFGTRDFESRASASSATPAVWQKVITPHG